MSKPNLNDDERKVLQYIYECNKEGHFPSDEDIIKNVPGIDEQRLEDIKKKLQQLRFIMKRKESDEILEEEMIRTEIEKMMGGLADKGLVYERWDEESDDFTYSLSPKGLVDIKKRMQKSLLHRMVYLDIFIKNSEEGTFNHSILSKYAIHMKEEFGTNAFLDLIEAKEQGMIDGIKINMTKEEAKRLYERL